MPFPQLAPSKKMTTPSHSLRIIYISNGDASTGGAGRIAQMLADGMADRGHRVTHLVRRKPAHEIPRKAKVKWFGRLPGERVLRELSGYDTAGFRLRINKLLAHADIIHFHDMALAWGERVADYASTLCPTFVTLHDFSNLSGGCMVPGTCKRFQTGCGNCPQPVRFWHLTLDRTRSRFIAHQSIASKNNITAIAPSRYIANAALQGAWRDGTVYLINNPVDHSVFNQYASNSAVDHANRLCLFVSSNISNPIKGFDDFSRIAARFKHQHDIQFIAVGSANAKVTARAKEFNIKIIGAVKNDRALATIYAMSDLLVMPTKGDNFPLTALEAMSCGTPVVAYDVGGLREALDKMPGCVILPKGDIQSLEKQITALVNTPNSNIIDLSCQLSKKATLRFSFSDYTDRHETLYSKHAQRRYN